MTSTKNKRACKVGYSVALDKFLPSLPRSLFNISLKKYAAIGQYDLCEAYSDSAEILTSFIR
jgi:hypothetical protein